MECSYLNGESALSLNKSYEEILRMLVAMINRPEVWVIAR